MEAIPLFHPHIPKGALRELTDTLSGRWIGQGPKVELFEKNFQKYFCGSNVAQAVGSGTDALHLAYLLAGIKAGDEVIVPSFTCTATNIPLLYIGAKVIFADVQPTTMNIDVNHVNQLVNERTKAIVCVHFGGLPCDMDELHAVAAKWNIPVIEDAAHALGAKYHGKDVGEISDFTIFSFQAIKHLTTGDGGMLSIKNRELEAKAKRLRWFGIERVANQASWENDITEIGYKYQMTDIAAALGLAALEEFKETLEYRQKLLKEYNEQLENVPGLTVVGKGFSDREHAAWVCTVLVEKRSDLQKKLKENNIESSPVHFRNDLYSIFGKQKNDLPNMDSVEDKYLLLPLHTKMHLEDVQRVCNVIRSGWYALLLILVF